MCRLFGMSGAPHRVKATFWLLEAPDSLSVQSRREPDGTGLGTFDAHDRPQVNKWPIAAYEDLAFAQEAQELESTSFVAHVRFASTGAVEPKNTHPFEQEGRLFAHNGVVQGLERLEAELGSHRRLVAGDTDSERLFALVTKEIDAHDGDVGAGLTAAVRWVAERLPIYAVNVILTTERELWALRYPQTHELYALERKAGGHHGGRHLDAASAAGTVRVRSGHLADHDAVIVASERMDENPGWRLMDPGELLHVGPELDVTARVVLDSPPAHQLHLEDLGARAAASQHPTAATRA